MKKALCLHRKYAKKVKDLKDKYQGYMDHLQLITLVINGDG